MSQIQSFILIIGALQGLLLFFLLLSDKRVNFASRLLGIQCLLLATTFVLPIIVASGEGPLAWTIGWLVFFPSSYGAITYLYCRTAITGTIPNKGDLIHLLPLLLCYFINVDILFSPEKALDYVTTGETISLRHAFTKFIFYGQAALYVLLLVRMLVFYQREAKQALSSYNSDVFRWLWTMVAFTVSIWSLKIVFHFFGMETHLNTFADLLLVLMVYFIAIVQWRNPSLFHIDKLTEQLERRKASNERSNNGLLEADMRSSIMQLVETQVKELALYRDQDLTLTSLADKIGVSAHQLSESINHHEGKNFNQFINEFRVAEVCEQLKQNSERKLIDLAMDAGFSSKSSFNAIFKKLTGQTPSQYRCQ